MTRDPSGSSPPSISLRLGLFVAWVVPVAFGLWLALQTMGADLVGAAEGDFYAPCAFAPKWGHLVASAWLPVAIIVLVGLAWTWLLWKQQLATSPRWGVTAAIYLAGVLVVGALAAVFFHEFWTVPLPTGAGCDLISGVEVSD